MAQVEVDVSRGLPCFDMVGLLSGEVKEARERIRVALRNAGIAMPVEKITVNISPAGIHKVGTAFDLPAALGIMATMGLVLEESLERVMIAGELGLNAQVKPIRGVLPMVMEAGRAGMEECLVPLDNMKEGMLADGPTVMGVENLSEAALYLGSGKGERAKQRRNALQKAEEKRKNGRQAREEKGPPDFCMIQGLEEAKYAAMAAAAGFHNLLFTGPPGAGKTMLAKCLPGILPPLTLQERREVSVIYSVAQRLEPDRLIKNRPFVSPHHTASPYALAGGGSVPRPGMVTLAHKGVLFLDEIAEFKRATLDILRQPMEEGKIFLAKGGGSFVYPADFMLVAAMNPCPCGYYPDRNRCRCSAWEVRRYLSRLSGPLLDRIDLFSPVRPVPLQALWEGEKNDTLTSAAMQERVLAARERQKHRYAGTAIQANGRLTGREVLQFCRLGFSGQQFLEKATEGGTYSARACHRILRLARTLADLDESGEIADRHLGQAVCFRQTEILTGI